jgi:hypothetical protein
MTNDSDPLAEYGPETAAAAQLPKPRNKTPSAKHIAYELPGSDHTYTCRPAPSSRRHDETEDQWLAASAAGALAPAIGPWRTTVSYG